MATRFWFKALALMQFLIFLMFFLAGLYMLAMSNSSRTDPEAVHGLQRSSMISLAICPLWLIPLIGIWQRWRWSWWMGLAVNLASFAIFFWALTYHEPSIDWVAMSGPAVFLIIAILHLFSRPSSWRSIGQSGSTAF
jgi:hypothetical protein